MSQNVRFVLFLLISIGIIFVWSAYFAPKPKPKGPDQAVATGTPDGGTPAPALGETAGGTPAPTPPAGGTPEEAEPEVATQKVDTAKWTAVFSTKGAGLQSFVLKGEKQHLHAETTGAGFNLAHPGEGQPLPLAVEVGPVGPAAGYKLVAQTDSELRYERTKAGWTVTKTFRWSPDSYHLGLDVQVQRADGVKEATPVSVLYPAHEPKPETGGFLTSALARAEIHQAVCHVSGASMETRGYKTEEKPPVTYPGAGFAGIDEKYFLAAIAPGPGQEKGSCTLSSPAATGLLATYASPLKDGAAKFDLYLGPKDGDALAAFGHEAEVSITNGGTGKLGRAILLPILKFFHDLVKNWGFAIILLTIVVKIVTFPLAHRQMKSMEGMKVLGPKMEEIKKKYENDPQKQNMETMRLYKEHNINPIGCAVPMLVQMPIWWALYATLQNSFELYNEPFFGWIKDLTVHDPFYVLPVLMTATMIITQVLTPQTSPQAQQMKGMTYGMPVFFGFMMMSLPAGLVLYIFTNNLLSIAQSLWFRKKFANQAPAK